MIYTFTDNAFCEEVQSIVSVDLEMIETSDLEGSSLAYLRSRCDHSCVCCHDECELQQALALRRASRFKQENRFGYRRRE